MSAVLTAEAVTLTFDDGTRALDGVSLEACPGTVTAVVGGSGSGRTTLLRCLTGVHRPDAGEVRLTLDGETVDLATADVRTLAWVRRHHVAVSHGTLAAPPRQSATDLVARAARLPRPEAAAALGLLGLGAAADQPVGRLRPAHRGLVALAAALWSDAPVVLVDDADTSGHDDVVAARLSDLTRAGAAVVLTTGPTSPLTGAADAVAHLDEGTPRWTRR